MKPVELYLRAISNSSKQFNNVADFFCGSGTAGVACIKLVRNLFACELKPRYCDVAIRRWLDFCKESDIGIKSFSRNGKPFEWPSLYEASGVKTSAEEQASQN